MDGVREKELFTVGNRVTILINNANSSGVMAGEEGEITEVVIPNSPHFYYRVRMDGTGRFYAFTPENIEISLYS